MLPAALYTLSEEQCEGNLTKVLYIKIAQSGQVLDTIFTSIKSYRVVYIYDSMASVQRKEYKNFLGQNCLDWLNQYLLAYFLEVSNNCYLIHIYDYTLPT